MSKTEMYQCPDCGSPTWDEDRLCLDCVLGRALCPGCEKPNPEPDALCKSCSERGWSAYIMLFDDRFTYIPLMIILESFYHFTHGRRTAAGEVLDAYECGETHE